MTSKKLLYILPLLISLSLTAQVRTARQEMLLYNYSKALSLLDKAYKNGNAETKQEASHLMAECYRRQNRPEQARDFYLKSIELGSRDPMDWFYLGLCRKSCGEYTAAQSAFLKYDSLVPSDPSGRLNAAFCDSAMAWQHRKPSSRVRNAGALNSPQSDFAPVFAGHHLYFVSDRNSGGSGEIYGWTGNSYLRIYEASVKEGDSAAFSFGTPVSGPEVFNRSFHDGPVCFSNGMDEAFINRTVGNRDAGRRDAGLIRTHLLKIWHSVNTGNKWSDPEPFYLNSDKYSVGHPALSPDGNTLYFVSDMDGGYGGTDIWSCTRINGQWDGPVNLGARINTKGNEMFPFLAEDGVLYFASDGLPGFGGLDIFAAKKQGGSWSLPHNLLQPLNSSFDDFALVTLPGGKAGLFSSNRPGGAGSDDIWCFSIVPEEVPPPPPPPPIAAETPKALPSFLSVGKAYKIENIYYDFDKWNIRKDAEHSLDSLIRIMNEYPVYVEIGSHTDCRGSEEYNEVLSQKRAESVVNYLVKQGIAPERLTARGYGKSVLINRCNCNAGVNCSEAEHQANRRTEFRITSVGR